MKIDSFTLQSVLAVEKSLSDSPIKKNVMSAFCSLLISHIDSQTLYFIH
jgi:hypothetical protein